MTATGPYSDGVGVGGAEPSVLYSLYSPASQSYPPPHHQYCAPAGFYPPHPVPLITRSSSNGSQAGVRTIILTGFPSDVKDRELNNLLLFLPGYQVCGVSILLLFKLGKNRYFILVEFVGQQFSFINKKPFGESR